MNSLAAALIQSLFSHQDEYDEDRQYVANLSDADSYVGRRLAYRGLLHRIDLINSTVDCIRDSGLLLCAWDGTLALADRKPQVDAS